MKKSKVSLGKGLSAILGNLSNDVISSSNKNLDNILISQIERNPFQPRNKFNQNKLDELALSIKQLGVIQPITVRKINLDKYQIISGERRYRASKIVGLENIPAYIRIANDQEMLEMALVENIQRENLNPIEIALSYKRLINECNLTQEECSLRVGKKRTTITNFMRLLKLPTEIQNGLSEGKISTGHARALINIKSKENQMNIYHDTVANYYSVREVEQIAKTFSERNYKRTSRNQEYNKHPFAQQKMIHDMTSKLKTEIELKYNKKGDGKIIIPFKNEEELKKIYEIIHA